MGWVQLEAQLGYLQQLCCTQKDKFLHGVIRDFLIGAVLYLEHKRRKTITAMEVVYALKRQGTVTWCYKLHRSVAFAARVCNIYAEIAFHFRG